MLELAAQGRRGEGLTRRQAGLALPFRAMWDLTRRQLLAAGGGGVLGLAVGGGSGYALGDRGGDSGGAGAVEFHGAHQAGIATPAQDFMAFGAFDLRADVLSEVAELMGAWTQAAAELTRGRPTAAGEGAPAGAASDSGEAVGLDASQLTITFGFGPSMFNKEGIDRYGVASRRPAGLRALGAFRGDRLEAERSDGDLGVQVCANDPQVAFHALRNLARIAGGVVTTRWTQAGFRPTGREGGAPRAPRNLQGFREGANNLDSEDAGAMRRYVWVGNEEPQGWLRGGTYLVTRRIRMLIEAWDATTTEDQEYAIGRFKLSGAPLTARREGEPVDLEARTSFGTPVIPEGAHIRVAAPALNDGQRILRRSYAFADGAEPATGELDAGLFFICFQRDPQQQFAAIQRRLASSDALGKYIEHRASALFAVPPGVRGEGFVGEELFRA